MTEEHPMLAIGALNIRDRRLEFNGGYKWRGLPSLDRLIIHHVGAGDHDSTAESIASYHAEVLGWPGIGYHLLVHWDGSIEYVGDILTLRYHAREFNVGGIGINVCGNWNERRPGDVQLDAAKGLCANLRHALGIRLPIFGHGELMQTACPGSTSRGPDGWLSEIRAAMP